MKIVDKRKSGHLIAFRELAPGSFFERADGTIYRKLKKALCTTTNGRRRNAIVFSDDDTDSMTTTYIRGDVCVTPLEVELVIRDES